MPNSIIIGLCLSIATMAHSLQAQDVQAGVTAAVRGEVEIKQQAEGEFELVKSGEKVFIGNTLKSHQNSGLQLILMDEAVFTLSSDTELVIDNFVYDPNNDNEGISTNVTKGAFRFVTGKIAQRRPGQMKFKVPSGTIGVRGTMGFVALTPDQGTLILNLGPGSEKGISDDKMGIIEVSGTQGTTTLVSVGYASLIGNDGTVSEAIPLPQDRLGSLLSNLSAASSDQGFEDNGRIASDDIENASGVGVTKSERSAEALQRTADQLAALRNTSVDSLQQIARDLALAEYLNAIRECGIRGDCEVID